MYFKIIHNLVDLNFDDFFVWSHGGVRMRGHNFKLELKKCNNNLLKFSFENRCVNCWNALPDNVVNSSSINMFMYRLKMSNLASTCRTLVDILLPVLPFVIITQICWLFMIFVVIIKFYLILSYLSTSFDTFSLSRTVFELFDFFLWRIIN